MKSTPPIARFSTSLLFGAVWPMYCPTRSSRVTATRWPLRTYPRRNRISAMRSATVVLPVPGLPVKLMCRLGACACSPRFMRSLSITSSAAMSRMRALIGVRPTRSRSSSSITAPAWLCASTSLTVRASADCGPWAAVAPVAGSGTGDAVPAALPGIEYSGEPTSGHLARRRRAAQFVAHRIDHRSIVRAAEYRAAGDEGVGTGGDEALDERIHRPHHQMHVQRRRHHRPDRQVRDEVIVHDVEVNPVGARGHDATHFLAQTGEVGGQDRWSDQVHGANLVALMTCRSRRARLRAGRWRSRARCSGSCGRRPPDV